LGLEQTEVDAVVMVVSELAADAVQHARLAAHEHFRLVVDIEDDGIVVAVRDSDRGGGPVSRLHRTGGFGWMIIRAVSVDWGCEPGGYSWVRLPRG
jgi:two-component sensor histidine kinase